MEPQVQFQCWLCESQSDSFHSCVVQYIVYDILQPLSNEAYSDILWPRHSSQAEYTYSESQAQIVSSLSMQVNLNLVIRSVSLVTDWCANVVAGVAASGNRVQGVTKWILSFMQQNKIQWLTMGSVVFWDVTQCWLAVSSQQFRSHWSHLKVHAWPWRWDTNRTVPKFW
jgi:hypothetical protein